MQKENEKFNGLANVSTLSQVLNIIIAEKYGVYRAEIARLTGFSKSTISQHVDKLIQNGFVLDGSEEQRGSSARFRRLHFNNNVGYVICIDLGATSMHVAICNLNGDARSDRLRENVNMNAGPGEILPMISRIVDELLKEANLRMDEIVGVGMGVPAPVEFSTGRPIAPPILQGGWGEYPLKAYLESTFHKPAFVDNDVNLVAIAEHTFGITAEKENSIYVKLGTGIGCGIFCGGKIYRGASGCAGDIGHISVGNDETVCCCGNKGCLERLAGGAAIAKKAAAMAESGESPFLAAYLKRGEVITCRTVRDGILAQDTACIAYIQTVGGYIGETLAKITNFFNPSIIVLGGGLTNFGDVLFVSIREAIFRHSSALATRELSVRIEKTGTMAGIRGAAILVRDELFSPLQFPAMLELQNR